MKLGYVLIALFLITGISAYLIISHSNEAKVLIKSECFNSNKTYFYVEEYGTEIEYCGDFEDIKELTLNLTRSIK